MHLRTPIIVLLLALSVAVASSVSCAAGMPPEQRSFFESKIRPALVKHCFECHSANAKKVGGKLLLDSPADMLSGGESGPALVAGKPDESLLIQALRYDGLEMPPKHRLPDQVVEDFVTWIRMGAPDPRAPVSTPENHSTNGTGESALWSFRPVLNPPIPVLGNTDWQRDPLDAFVLAKIEAAGLVPAPDAAPEVLARRLYYDLVGLPPDASEMEDFLLGWRANKTAAWMKLVDRLLASPHFGERWGRHWLDVARFAESNGNDGLGRNPTFPHAWRYRDYVIQSFNRDVPYDRFIAEQIAGDLLPSDSAEQRDRQLVATGFLAVGSKPAKAMNDNFEMDVVADQIGVVGSGILGLSLSCARCHDHKHDPVSARDYYALAGVFRSTETLWGAAGLEPLTAPQTPLHELQSLLPAPPPVDTERPKPVRESKKKPAKAAFAYPPGAALAMGVREAKSIEDCKLNIGGESKRLGAAIPRGFPGACRDRDESMAMDPTQSGRLQLVRWLTDGKHPQTARVFVNRVWLHLFGEGLVRTPDDFGVYGDRPANPELLDYLATEFVRDGWSIKRLIRRIVLSRTWQLSSDCDARLRTADPDNTLFARHNRRRLDAEAIRDTVLAACGELDRSPGVGSRIQHEDILVNEMGNLHRPSNKRSVYLLMLRNSMPRELVPFNFPDGTSVTGRRDVTTLPSQALYLLNSRFMVDCSRALASRLLAECTNESEIVIAAHRRIFARNPYPAERMRGERFLSDTMAAGGFSGGTQRIDDLQACAAFCQSLLASNELLYLD